MKTNIQNVQIELLTEFIKICKKYNLQWCLAYGTLLGAIRHHDFIPWDHDVDVMMPFDDYYKLYELNKSEKLFSTGIYLADYEKI